MEDYKVAPRIRTLCLRSLTRSFRMISRTALEVGKAGVVAVEVVMAVMALPLATTASMKTVTRTLGSTSLNA